MATGVKISALPVATDFSGTDIIPIVTGGATESITHDVLMADKQICVAWVNFNGTGTPTIRDSFNVASITDVSTGKFKLNFTNALADANYSPSGMCEGTGSGAAGVVEIDTATDFTTTDLTILTKTSSTQIDSTVISVHIFGGVA